MSSNIGSRPRDTSGRNPAGSSSRLWKGVSILLVGGEPGARSSLQRLLARQYALVEAVDGTERAEQLLLRCHIDLIVLDAASAGGGAIDWVCAVRSGGSPDVILVASNPDLSSAVGALRCGAADFVPNPSSQDEIAQAVRRYFERASRRRERAPAEPSSTAALDTMVGESRAIQSVRDMIERIAPTPATVLIEGETGTGKELVARHLHAFSGRSGPFVAVNCGAISAELLESELFGHTKGAFTSAHQSRDGLFVTARSGTIFLDEISEMPLDMQVKLLRVLEESTVRPVGSDREVPVDTRIIAATHRSLSERVREGRFREDLYYRINVMSIRLPSLRERVDDIPALAQFFMRAVSAELAMPPLTLSEADVRRLTAHDWPGNVRELRNVVERTVLLGHLPEDCVSPGSAAPAVADGHYPLDWSLEQVEVDHMERVLEACAGNKSAAARSLGVSRKTLERRLK
jgi:DNA-binding NtrC family response regulator